MKNKLFLFPWGLNFTPEMRVIHSYYLHERERARRRETETKTPRERQREREREAILRPTFPLFPPDCCLKHLF